MSGDGHDGFAVTPRLLGESTIRALGITSPSCRSRPSARSWALSTRSDSSCTTIGSRTGCSPLTMPSSITAATPGTSWPRDAGTECGREGRSAQRCRDAVLSAGAIGRRDYGSTRLINRVCPVRREDIDQTCPTTAPRQRRRPRAPRPMPCRRRRTLPASRTEPSS
jgi:hypothetical protein